MLAPHIIAAVILAFVQFFSSWIMARMARKAEDRNVQRGLYSMICLLEVFFACVWFGIAMTAQGRIEGFAYSWGFLYSLALLYFAVLLLIRSRTAK